MTKTTTRTELGKSDVTELVHVFKPGSKIVFEDGYHHYIHAGALAGMDILRIEGLKNAEIYFLAPYPHHLEFMDCENVIVGGRKSALTHHSTITFLDAESL